VLVNGAARRLGTTRSANQVVFDAASGDSLVEKVNSRPTRGDAKATVRVDAPLAEVLPELAGRLA
jgi:hypothetical protein